MILGSVCTRACSFCNIETGKPDIVLARPDVFNHNIETTPSLYATIRPGARYFHSLWLLKRVKELNPLIWINGWAWRDQRTNIASNGRYEMRRYRFYNQIL